MTAKQVLIFECTFVEPELLGLIFIKIQNPMSFIRSPILKERKLLRAFAVKIIPFSDQAFLRVFLRAFAFSDILALSLQYSLPTFAIFWPLDEGVGGGRVGGTQRLVIPFDLFSRPDCEIAQ